MRLTFHGAAQEVTGSAHILEVGGKRILLDCGLYQGKRKEAFEKNRQFPYDPASIDAVLLSHAHMDHSGNLPTLVKKRFQGQNMVYRRNGGPLPDNVQRLRTYPGT